MKRSYFSHSFTYKMTFVSILLYANESNSFKYIWKIFKLNFLENGKNLFHIFDLMWNPLSSFTKHFFLKNEISMPSFLHQVSINVIKKFNFRTFIYLFRTTQWIHLQNHFPIKFNFCQLLDKNEDLSVIYLKTCKYLTEKWICQYLLNLLINLKRFINVTFKFSSRNFYPLFIHTTNKKKIHFLIKIVPTFPSSRTIFRTITPSPPYFDKSFLDRAKKSNAYDELSKEFCFPARGYHGADNDKEEWF